jgi:hypothetical protein
MSASEIGGRGRDPKPGGRYALDDARRCRNMLRNGSDELRVRGDLTRFLARGVGPLERRPGSGTQIARDLSCQPRSTPIRCGFESNAGRRRTAARARINT